MNYYIADTHFFHKNMLKGAYHPMDERPFDTIEEMHDTIKTNWNKKVHSDDHVYMIGDVAMKCELDELIGLVGTLKGNKHLIRGGHDKHANDSRYRQLFVEVTDYKEMTDNIGGKQHRLVLSHYPLFSWNGLNRSVIHLYGHVHETWEYKQYLNHLAELNDHYKSIDQDRWRPIMAYNVGCMLWNYEPVTLKEIMTEGWCSS